MEHLENLKSVDEVRIFHTDQDLIDIIKECSIMVKGSDYVGKTIVGSEYCKEIKFFNRINEYSTTNKIKRSAQRPPHSSASTSSLVLPSNGNSAVEEEISRGLLITSVI
jgi:glycerol-3-phosphate cytidylyltransferase-like family protein